MKNSGFTLVEIIVSVAIFTVVMLIVMGALLSLNDSSRKAQALRTVIDNLNFAIEDMTRKIRTGSSYHCYISTDIVPSSISNLAASPCTGEGNFAISLQTQSNGPFVVYKFYPPVSGGYGSIKIAYDNNDGLGLQPWSAITSPEVNIENLNFQVIGTASNQQPMVILNISGVVDIEQEKLRTDFSIQTAVSRRGID